jgi:hypothetical protein
MFRKGRRCLVIALVVAAFALPAAPAAAAGGEGGAGWTAGMELWARLGEIGDWLRATFLSDGTSYIDPNGLQGSTSNGTDDHTSYIDPNG